MDEILEAIANQAFVLLAKQTVLSVGDRRYPVVATRDGNKLLLGVYKPESGHWVHITYTVEVRAD